MYEEIGRGAQILTFKSLWLQKQRAYRFKIRTKCESCSRVNVFEDVAPRNDNSSGWTIKCGSCAAKKKVSKKKALSRRMKCETRRAPVYEVYKQPQVVDLL